MPSDYIAYAYHLGSLGDDAGKENSTATAVQITFTDSNSDGLIKEESSDLIEGKTVETMKDESILKLDDGGTVKGWYATCEVGGETEVYFVPTDGTIPADDKLKEDIDLQGEQKGDIDDLTPVVPCFTAPSLISTIRGLVPAGEVCPGDLVLTRDNGFQTVRWVGHRSLSKAELAVFASLRPIRIRRHSFGPNIPERDLIVSRNHRILIESSAAQLNFGESEVLVAAKHLINRSYVDTIKPGFAQGALTYVHIMFDQHELVHSDGTWTESFCPGPQILKGFQRDQQDELFTLFPDLREQKTQLGYELARLELKKSEVAVLV